MCNKDSLTLQTREEMEKVCKMMAVPIETTTRKSIDGLIAEHLSGVVERLQAKK